MIDLSSYGSDDEEAGTAGGGISFKTAYEPVRTKLTDTRFGQSLSLVPLLDKQLSGAQATIGQEIAETLPITASTHALEHGPAHPFKFADGTSVGSYGRIETTAIEDWTFNQQYQTYQRSGYAIDSSTNSIIGNTAAFAVDQTFSKHPPTKRSRVEDAEIGDEDDDDETNGPWAPVPVEPKVVERVDAKATAESKHAANKAAHVSIVESAESSDPTMHIVEPDEEDEKWEKLTERKIGFTMPPRPQRGSQASEAKSTFHG